jgi:hypothetical protein
MKKIFKISLFAAALFTAVQVNAQSTPKKVGKDIGKAAKKVGNKTSEVASKGAAGVVDKKYEGKVAPNGEQIYIDKNSAYYYVNKKGHHIYVKKSELVDKPVN